MPSGHKAISLQPDHLQQCFFLYQNGVAFNILSNGTIFGNVDHQLMSNIGQILAKSSLLQGTRPYLSNQTTYSNVFFFKYKNGVAFNFQGSHFDNKTSLLGGLVAKIMLNFQHLSNICPILDISR